MHRIRLHGPWTLIAGERRERFRVPGAVPNSIESSSVITLARLFNKPTGLDSNPSVYLAGHGQFPDSSQIRLNDQTIDHVQDNQFRCEIGQLLESSNQLTIEVTEFQNEIRIDQLCLEIDE